MGRAGLLTSVLDLEDVHEDAEHEQEDTRPEDDPDLLLGRIPQLRDQVRQRDKAKGQDTVYRSQEVSAQIVSTVVLSP